MMAEQNETTNYPPPIGSRERFLIESLKGRYRVCWREKVIDKPYTETHLPPEVEELRDKYHYRIQLEIV